MKNSIIFLFIIIIFISSCEKDETTETNLDLNYGCTDTNSFNYDPNADVDDGTCKSMLGCLGYSPGFINSGTRGVSVGDPYWDQKISEEVIIQRRFWGDNITEFWILYESNGTINAWADPAGEILFGRNMFYHILNTYNNPLPSAGVIAHEFAHRVQQILFYQYDRIEYQELEADAFSGFYMALVKNYPWNDINSFFANTYMSGDTNFNSPNHHGTPLERVASARFGFETAIGALNNGIVYSYNDLHSLFYNEIKNRIATRSPNQFPEYKELEYPPNLTEEYIESLFPIF